jgi:hypothetical protein
MVAVTINEDDNLIIVSGTVSIVRNGKRVEYPFSTEIRMDEDRIETKPTEEAPSTAFVKIVKHTQQVDRSKIEKDNVHEFELFATDSLKIIDRQKIEDLINEKHPSRKGGRQSSSATKEQFTQAACILAANILKALVNRQYLRYGKRIQFDHHMFYSLTRYHYDKLAKLFEQAGFFTQVKQGYSAGKNSQSSLWEVSSSILSFKVSNESLQANHEPLVTEDYTDGRGPMTPEEEAEHAPHSRHRLTTIAPDFLKRINLPAVPPYRSFNDNGNLGGRVYCGMVQQVPKAVRQETLRIDDQPTVEVDFSASHLQLLSKIVTGEWIDLPDPYGFMLPNGQKADRDMCKEFLTRAPNAINVYGAMKKANWTKEEYELYRDGFKAAYPEIAEWFGTMAGCYLQKVEGDILETLMYEYYTEHNEILFPIHDAVICRQGIEDRVAQDMIRIREDVVSRYPLEDMRAKLQHHDDVRRAKLFEKAEQQKEQQKGAEETPFVEDAEEFGTSATGESKPKYVITEADVAKAKVRLKEEADRIGEVMMKTSVEIDTMMYEEEVGDFADNRAFYELFEIRLIAKGLKQKLVSRIISDLRNGVDNPIRPLYLEDIELVSDKRSPRWFLVG